MPLPDWLSWELWTTALYAVLDGPRRLAVWIWAGYVLNRADRERRITESFAKAVEQLGSERLETRLGAIYTLKRIAGESQREYWPIMETLTAFVREHAPRPPADATRMNSSPPTAHTTVRFWSRFRSCRSREKAS